MNVTCLLYGHSWEMKVDRIVSRMASGVEYMFVACRRCGKQPKNAWNDAGELMRFLIKYRCRRGAIEANLDEKFALETMASGSVRLCHTKKMNGRTTMEEKKIEATLTITLFDDGTLNVNGPINNMIFCFGLLECAKEELKAYAAKRGPRIEVPPTMIPPGVLKKFPQG